MFVCSLHIPITYLLQPCTGWLAIGCHIIFKVFAAQLASYSYIAMFNTAHTLLRLGPGMDLPIGGLHGSL